MEGPIALLALKVLGTERVAVHRRAAWTRGIFSYAKAWSGKVVDAEGNTVCIKPTTFVPAHESVCPERGRFVFSSAHAQNSRSTESRICNACRLQSAHAHYCQTGSGTQSSQKPSKDIPCGSELLLLITGKAMPDEHSQPAPAGSFHTRSHGRRLGAP